jgi:hypothetical protein
MTFKSLLDVYMNTDDAQSISDAFNRFVNEESTRLENGDEIVELYDVANADMFEWIANGLKCDVTRLTHLRVVIHQ